MIKVNNTMFEQNPSQAGQRGEGGRGMEMFECRIPSVSLLSYNEEG